MTKKGKHTVLFICLGNICRSPAAEGIMKSLVEKAGLQDEFEIDSAGIGGWHIGQLPDSRMRKCGAEHGYNFNSHARQFQKSDFARFETIVVMDNENYRAITSMASSESDRKKVVRMADFLTHHREYTTVPDPYYGDYSDFELVITLLEDACHEGAIDIINGKAELVREHFCDGLGDCLPECPTGAISFEEREAPAYDEEAVKEAQKKVFAKNQAMSTHTGCPGSRSMQIQRSETPETIKSTPSVEQLSKLQNWPVQIKLAPVSAPYFDGAKLLIAADCTAYAYASFHQDFIRNKVTLIGCPKLDQVDYSEKLTAIIQNNNIQSVTIVRMVVPCCGGLEIAAKKALQDSGKFLPWQVITISIDGKIME